MNDNINDGLTLQELDSDVESVNFNVAAVLALPESI